MIIVYTGLVLAAVGLGLVPKPIQRLGVPTRRRALGVVAAGMFLFAIGLALPAVESRVNRVETRLDEFAPVWQFSKFHTIAVAAPPGRVFEAIG